MKRIATGLLVALSYAKADTFFRSYTNTSPVTPFYNEDPVKACEAAHCSEVSAILQDTCKKNNWQNGHIVVVYDSKTTSSCYCTCASSITIENYNREPEGAIRFISQEEARIKALDVDAFRPMSDLHPKEWALDLLAYHKNFFPEVEFHLLWEDNTVNAFANIDSKGQRHVTIYGGLVRHKSMNVEGLALVIAHEVGHHYAGLPRYGGGNSWASCEGQSDYGGVRDLMRKVWFGQEYADITKKAIPQMAGFFGCKDDPTIPTERGNGCNHPPCKCRIATYYTALTLEHEKPKCADV